MGIRTENLIISFNIEPLGLSKDEKKILEDLTTKALNLSFQDTLIKKYKAIKDNIYDIEVFIITDKQIKEYNKLYRDIDKATNVISLQMFTLEEILRLNNPENSLGVIFISYDTLLSEAKEYGISKENHFQRLLIHAFLHIVGYNHLEEKDAKTMLEKEDKLLDKLSLDIKGITNNYWENN